MSLRALLVIVLAAIAVAGCGSTGVDLSGVSPCRTSAAPGAGAGGQPAAPAAIHGFVRTPVQVPHGEGGGAFSSRRSLTIPSGWTVAVWARVPGARFLAWTPERTLLVSVPAAGSVLELSPQAGAAKAPRQCVLLHGLTSPQGMAFDTVSGRRVLYVAESDAVDRYVWRSGRGVGARTVIARHLPDQDSRGDDVHSLKSLTVGPDHRVYVNIGSAFNASTLDVNGNPPRASVVSFAPDGGGMRVVATGVRNGEGLAFAPDGVLWSAINERDQIPYPFHGAFGGVAHAYGKVIPGYVNEHPPDEVVALRPGRNVGWPYCNPDPARGFASMGFDDDEQNNPGGGRLACGRLQRIERGLPAHSAPLGFHFLQGSALPSGLTHGAILAVHGSWDRHPPRPPAVLWLPWTGGSLGAPVTLVSGFQAADGSRWGRPADAVPGPDGALYVSDDLAGAIYRIVP